MKKKTSGQVFNRVKSKKNQSVKKSLKKAANKLEAKSAQGSLVNKLDNFKNNSANPHRILIKPKKGKSNV